MGRKNTKRKGRQDVQRHWKPSLGRYVEQYDRTGENARPRQRPVIADGLPLPTPKGPRLGRRLVISGCVFALLLGVIGGFRLARQGGDVGYDVLVASKPVVVRIDHGAATRVALATPAELDTLVREAVTSVRATAAKHPERLIVIELVRPVISYESLPASDQREVGRDDYESAVALFLENVLTALANPRVSILGLPAEPGSAGIAAARRTNDRYADVIKRLDHLVTAHIFFRTASWVTEQRMVEEAIPQAMHLAQGRPIVFRLNLEWRVVVDHEDVGRYRRADWNTLE